MIRDFGNRIVRYSDPRVQLRNRARAAQEPDPIGDAYDVEQTEEALARECAVPVAPSAPPCRCGCGRVGVSRDYVGFASRDCVERGEER